MVSSYAFGSVKIGMSVGKTVAGNVSKVVRPVVGEIKKWLGLIPMQLFTN